MRSVAGSPSSGMVRVVWLFVFVLGGELAIVGDYWSGAVESRGS